MAENSKIEWTKHTANLWIGCNEVHAGCDNCYARVQNHRWGHDNWGGKNTPRRRVKKVWTDLNRYQKLAAEAGEVHRVFVGSFMDIFEIPMPAVHSDGNKIYRIMSKEAYIESFTPKFGYETELTTGDLRQIFFNQISANYYPNLFFILLTKRPSNINKYIPESWKINPPKNVIFMASVVDQKTADQLIPHLLKVNGAKGLSIEPQLNEICLDSHLWETCKVCGGSGSVPVDGGGKACSACLHPFQGLVRKPGIDWVICGGESGSKRRPFNLNWGKSLKEQCKQAGVPFFFKQIDKVRDKTEGVPDALMVREFPEIMQ